MHGEAGIHFCQILRDQRIEFLPERRSLSGKRWVVVCYRQFLDEGRQTEIRHVVKEKSLGPVALQMFLHSRPC
jgi:hypothetical protein